MFSLYPRIASASRAFRRIVISASLVTIACSPQSTAVTPSPAPAASAVAASSPAASTAAPTASPSAPPRVVFQAVAGVTDRDQADVKRGIDLMSSTLEKDLGGDATRLTVLMTHDGASPPPPPELSGTCCGFIGRGTVAIDVGHTDWTRPDPFLKDATHVKIAAHEYLHAWQDTLGCRIYQGPRAVAPAWIVEGISEYLAYRVVIGAGLVDPAPVRRNWIDEAQFKSSLRLAGYETAAPGQPLPYGILILANERLATKGSYRTFCDGVSSGRPWREAFAGAYGMSADAFYADFETWRAGGFR